MFSRPYLCTTPTRTRLKTSHRAELPFRSSHLSHSTDYSSRSLLFFLVAARQRWWRSPVVGARRIGEYRESKTEATRFRRAFFLVSRALRSLERPESCARPPARGCPLPFTTPRSATTVAPSRANPSLSVLFTLPRIAHPCVRPCLVIPRYAMPRHTTLHRTVSSPLSRLS